MTVATGFLEIEMRVGKRTFDSIEAGFSFLETAIKTAPEGATVPVNHAARDALQRVARLVAQSHGKAWNGSMVNGGDTLQKRSGSSIERMRRSVRVGGNLKSSVWGHIKTGFWAIHETGGTIRATRSQYLTIPLPAAMDPRGVPLRKRASDWNNTFVARSRRGNLIIFQKRGRQNIAPLYLLKKSVYIPPRLKFEETLNRDGVPYFEQKSMDALEREILRRIDG